MAVPRQRPMQQLLAQIVDEGLSREQKSLPSYLFYDEEGSRLFEEITRLSEYYLTACEAEILQASASEIVSQVGQDVLLIEFGSGSSKKTRLVIEALIAKQQQLTYVPIDISAEFLNETAKTLEQTYARLTVKPLTMEYGAAMEALPSHTGPRLFLFLGSNIGNFEKEEAVSFLTNLRKRMHPADRLQLGLDLAKDRSIVEPAYNDSEGVTETFNKNVLKRINLELGGQFELDCFEHRAPYIEEEMRIEMRLVSRRNQVVSIGALNKSFAFRAGEFIHTENSHKYKLEQFETLAQQSGLAVCGAWYDSRHWFAELLLKPIS